MKKHVRELRIAILKQVLLLTTGGFSLVAALAWNEVIKNFIDTFIKPYVNKGSSIIALLIYALSITILAVAITLYLGKVLAKLEEGENKEEPKN